MRRSETVFFFTLVDFLLQICFFGLFIFVTYHSVQAGLKHVEDKRRKGITHAVDMLQQHFGISNLVELTDYLTKLVPANQLKGWAEFYSGIGSADARQIVDFVRQNGGIGEVEKKLRQLEEGSGKPPCIYDVRDGKKVRRILASALADDTSIRFLRSTADLEAVLALLGANYSEVERLALRDFRQRFEALRRIKPECRYSLLFFEATPLRAPRDAARHAFYLEPKDAPPELR